MPSMIFPEYTLSLTIWIVPIILMIAFFVKRRLLSPEKLFALGITVILLAAIGIVLDLFFGLLFFNFPNKEAILGIYLKKIPIEEFVFYITGFWFIIFVYVFCDEYFLVKYNVPDEYYARFRSKISRMIFVHTKSLIWAVVLLIAGFVIKRILNPAGEIVPGYFFFLLICAYTPTILFYRVTKNFINWQAFSFSLCLTVLLSIIWEVTLAIPRGYWGYNPGAMLGIFIDVWHNLPLEAVTVWIFSTLVIMVYEFLKIRYFTRIPSVPGHGFLVKFGRDWRNYKK